MRTHIPYLSWLYPFLFFTGWLQAQPNVILITVDTLRADHIQNYGCEDCSTPAFSQLANDGITFEKAYVQTPITLPSHTTIMTGTYPMFHQVIDVVGRVPDRATTLAEWFKGKSYKTGAIVGSAVLLSQWGLNRGFDLYDDRFSFAEGMAAFDFDQVERPAGAVIDLGTKWVRENREKPFFLWLHLYDPHHPYTPPAPYSKEYSNRLYDGEIAYVDTELGRFFKFLADEGLYDESLIVLTADHGESLGEHNELYHGFFVYEASLRVPLIFKLPGGKIPRRGSSDGPEAKGLRIPYQVRSVDIAPTVIQLLGERTPPSMQGQSLLSLMMGRRPAGELPVYAESYYPRLHFGWNPVLAYVNSDKKLIETTSPELYDLERDPRELENLHEGQSALAASMKAELQKLQQQFAAKGEAAAGPEVDPVTMEKLKSLGYVAFSGGTAGLGIDPNLPDPKEKVSVFNKVTDAISASRSGQRAQAISILEGVVKSEPDLSIGHFMLGSEYMAAEEYLRAVQEFQTTVRIAPDSNMGLFNLAIAYGKSGLSEKSEETLRSLLKQSPDDFGGHHALAALQAEKGRYEEAITLELRAIEIRPYAQEALSNLSSHYVRNGDYEKAIQAALKALELSPNLVDPRIYLSLSYLKLGRPGLALEQAQVLVKNAPNYALGHYYLGRALLALGQKDKAKVSFERARQLQPTLAVPDL